MDILPALVLQKDDHLHVNAKSFCSQEQCFCAPGSSPGPAVPRTLEFQHMLAGASTRKEARLVQNAGRAPHSSNCGLLPPTRMLFSRAGAAVYWGGGGGSGLGACRAGASGSRGGGHCLRLVCSTRHGGTCSVTRGVGRLRWRQEGLGWGSRGEKGLRGSTQQREPRFHRGPRDSKEQMAGPGAASAGPERGSAQAPARRAHPVPSPETTETHGPSALGLCPKTARTAKSAPWTWSEKADPHGSSKPH